MGDAERQVVLPHVLGQPSQRFLCGLIWEAIQWDVTEAQCPFKRSCILSLQTSDGDNPWTNQVSVRQAITDDIFNAVSKIVLTALLGTRMTDLIA